MNVAGAGSASRDILDNQLFRSSPFFAEHRFHPHSAELRKFENSGRQPHGRATTSPLTVEDA